jgi:acetyltransferase EpsM
MTLYIIGNGDFGAVVREAISDSGILGWYGDCEFLENDRHLDSVDFIAYHHFVVAIGNQQKRRELSERVAMSLVTVVHPKALVSPSARIGAGSIILQGAIVNVGARIGRFCIVNVGAIVSHHCELEDGVQVCDGAVLTGNVKCREGAFIGANATVLPGICLGAKSIVGAGAVVTKGITDIMTVVGNPARRLYAEPIT